MAKKTDSPKSMVQPSARVLLGLLVIVLVPAVALLLFAESRPQVVRAYVLFPLVVAIVTFSFLGAFGVVKTKTRQLGGSAAVFVVVLAAQLPFSNLEEKTVEHRRHPLRGWPTGQGGRRPLAQDRGETSHQG